jgi:hypothetical protein
MAPDTIPADLERLPIRLDLELPPAVLEQLKSLSQTTGRSIDELALQLIDWALQQDSGAEAICSDCSD